MLSVTRLFSAHAVRLTMCSSRIWLSKPSVTSKPAHVLSWCCRVLPHMYCLEAPWQS